MKKFLTLLLAILMVLTLAGCGQKEEEGTETEVNNKVYFVAPLATGSAWGTCGTAFLAKCEELGLEGYYLGPTAAANTAEMVELVELAVSNDAAVIIGNWRDQESFNDVVDRALEKGIKLVGSNYQLPGRCENYLGIDPTQLGYAQAETLVENMEGKEIKVFYFTPRLDSQSHMKNHDAFVEKLMELRPDAEVVAYEESQGDALVAAEKVNAVMIAHPEINSIVTNCSFAAVASAAYKEENAISDDVLYVQGIDGGADILGYVRDGFAKCTIIQDWVGVGEAAANLALDLINGKEIPTFTGLGAYALYADGVQEYADSQGIELN